MQCVDFLDTVEQRLTEQIVRGRFAGHAVSPDQLNRSPEPPKKWSMAQIYEHMMLANANYLQTIKDGIDAAQHGPQAGVKHTFFGKFIIRGAGPQGIDRWAAQTQAFLDLAKSARHVDLCSLKVQNPFIPILKINLADCFMIIAEHTERHVQQIEVLQSWCLEEVPAKAS